MSRPMRAARSHVATVEPQIDYKGRPTRSRHVIPVCLSCGRLTYPTDAAHAKVVAAEHVSWSRDNPDAAAALADERAAMLRTSGVVAAVGTDMWHEQMTHRLPPLFAPTPKSWEWQYGTPAYATQ